jgi:Ser/Thr protein kinase RdoA (MazF antagonist)
VPVGGGLSNELWRVTSGADVFAVKVMRVNAETPEFADNVEAAFLVEQAAFDSGVPCPRPLPARGGGCLARIDGRWVRVHQWVDGGPVEPGQHFRDAARLLAAIHAVGEPVEDELEDEAWDEASWSGLADTDGLPRDLAADLLHAAPALADLEAVTAAPGLLVPHVLSHGDLDPKNTLIVDGTLMAIDWDAAGSQPSAREAVTVALDWTTTPDGFRETLRSYSAAGGAVPPAQPWVFGGWVSAIGGWLVYNVSHHAEGDIRVREAEGTLRRLATLHTRLPEYLAAID